MSCSYVITGILLSNQSRGLYWKNIGPKSWKRLRVVILPVLLPASVIARLKMFRKNDHALEKYRKRQAHKIDWERARHVYSLLIWIQTEKRVVWRKKKRNLFLSFWKQLLWDTSTIKSTKKIQEWSWRTINVSIHDETSLCNKSRGQVSSFGPAIFIKKSSRRDLSHETFVWTVDGTSPYDQPTCKIYQPQIRMISQRALFWDSASLLGLRLGRTTTIHLCNWSPHVNASTD